MEITITTATVITAASVLAAVTAICAAGVKCIKWFQTQDQQGKDIKSLQDEQCLLTYGVLACLKGLSEQGCNGPVTDAIDKIEKHINKAAHHQGQE